MYLPSTLRTTKIKIIGGESISAKYFLCFAAMSMVFLLGCIEQKPAPIPPTTTERLPTIVPTQPPSTPEQTQVPSEIPTSASPPDTPPSNITQLLTLLPELEHPATTKYNFIRSFVLDRTFSPELAKAQYTISFVIVKPTNSKNYNFNDAELQQIIAQMDEFWNEMSHGKTRLSYDKKYILDFPGQITCLKISLCPESWPDHNILAPKFEQLGIMSDIIVALIDADISGHLATASRSFEQIWNERWPGGAISTIHKYRQWSVVFSDPRLFGMNMDERVKTLSHEFFHTRKFLLAEDTYVGAPRLIPPPGLSAEYYSITEDLMGGGMLTSYLAGYKRAELGWEEYSDLNAFGQWATVNFTPNCISNKIHRIPLGVAKDPPIEWYKAKANDIYYHSIFLEWVGNSACKWDKSQEGIRITEVYEIYEYYTKRYQAVYERDITNTLNNFNSDKISIKILDKKTDNIRAEVKTNLQKQQFTSHVAGQIFNWTDQCFEGGPAAGTNVVAAGLSYNTTNALILILQSNKDARFVTPFVISPEFYQEEKYTTWIRGIWPSSRWIVDENRELSQCPDPPVFLGTRGDFAATFSEFDRCDFSVILLDSVGNYYEFNYKDVVPNCS